MWGNGHDEGTRTKARVGSNRNALTGVGIVTGPSSVKPAMTKDGRLKSGCTTPRALPSNDTSRLKAKPTRTIQPMKPTSKNGRGSHAGKFRGSRTLRYLWYEQGGLCTQWNAKITRITGWRLHYCVPRVKGGSTGATNCVLFHPECHDRVHRRRLPVSKPRLLHRGVRRSDSSLIRAAV
jgi:5-methylcytosine-specific restriction endonuclease McrA